MRDLDGDRAQHWRKPKSCILIGCQREIFPEIFHGGGRIWPLDVEAYINQLNTDPDRCPISQGRIGKSELCVSFSSGTPVEEHREAARSRHCIQGVTPRDCHSEATGEGVEER